jgi:hypothetical protein
VDAICFLLDEEQQPPLSQLASLAENQNGSTNSALGQSQVSMGLGIGFNGQLQKGNDTTMEKNYSNAATR